MIGGAVTGAAIGAMHYVGMAAVRIPAVAIWDWHYVVASAVIGISAMALGMQIVIRGSGWRPQAAGAVIFTLAICSMHFTGMSAVTYRLDPTVLVPDIVVEPTMLAIAVAAVAILIVALGLVGSLVDSHLSERARRRGATLARPYRGTGSDQGQAGADNRKPEAGAGRRRGGQPGEIRLSGRDEP